MNTTGTGYNLSDKQIFKDIKDACLWLMIHANFKLSSIYTFYGLHPNTLTNWQKKLDSGKTLKYSKNKYVQEFLDSNNNSINKKHKMLDIDMVGEIKWVILNSNYPRYVISKFYGIDDNYISQLKSGYAWENVIPVKPDNIRIREIEDGLNVIDNTIGQEIKDKKNAVAWLLLYSNLELLEISHLLELNYLHVYRVYQKGKSKKQVWLDMSKNISTINYNYDFSNGKYFHSITKKV
jgi:hypothetical protein